MEPIKNLCYVNAGTQNAVASYVGTLRYLWRSQETRWFLLCLQRVPKALENLVTTSASQGETGCRIVLSP